MTVHEPAGLRLNAVTLVEPTIRRDHKKVKKLYYKYNSIYGNPKTKLVID